MNRRRATRVAAVLLILFLAGCTGERKTQRHAFFALGTVVEISVFDPPRALDMRTVETALLRQEQRWRAWGEGGLADANRRLATGETVEFDAAMLAVIERARELSELSGGRFNPAMGRVVEAWGFHEEQRETEPPPGDGTLAGLLPPPELSALVQAGNGRWRSEDPRLWIDMGAFAKGIAVEIAVRVLREHGIENAIVNAGGDLKVIGRHGDRAWNIGVRDPRGSGVLAAIKASGEESVFTSGDYERYFEWDGRRYHHILDPVTARPARGVTSVTVIHPDAALADAAATALFVAGPQAWRETARALGIDKAMLVLENGDVEATPAMRSRLEFQGTPPDLEIVTP